MRAVDLGSTVYSCPRKCEQRRAFHLAVASSASSVSGGVHVECVGGGGVHIACEYTCADSCLEEFPEENFPSYGRIWSISTKKRTFYRCYQNYIFDISGVISGKASWLCFQWTGGRLRAGFMFSFFILFSHTYSHLFSVKIFIELSKTLTVFKLFLPSVSECLRQEYA